MDITIKVHQGNQNIPHFIVNNMCLNTSTPIKLEYICQNIVMFNTFSIVAY